MKPMRTLRAAVFMAVAASLIGCASSLGHMYHPCPFVGVQLDFESWDAVGPLMIVDLPFSAVMDTALLPLDLIHGGDCSGL
ncbi:YceK/YidQ family lipoprotein [Pseudomonas citronellolis]|uniref:YceK/YidQ family lipoprotein n=1 Tax=Pseudomonas citronellolis TaxID=53408 RepID=UPI0009F36E38